MLRVKQLIIFAMLFCGFLATAQAAIEVYQFDSEEKTKRFNQLTEELRCPKCQNQNIADSNAEIAQDLRSKIQQMLVEDKSDEDIVQYMLDRYGDFVLYAPRVTGQTYLLWFGPIVFLLFALLVVFFIVRMRSQRSSESSSLNSDQQQQLADLLDKQQDSSE